MRNAYPPVRMYEYLYIVHMYLFMCQITITDRS